MRYDATKIDMLFLEKVKNIIIMERELSEHIGDAGVLYKAKKMGFSDAFIGKLWGKSDEEIYKIREKRYIFPVYKMIDTCASEFESYIPTSTRPTKTKTSPLCPTKRRLSFSAPVLSESVRALSSTTPPFTR